MPIITASSSSDISPQGPASSAGKEAGSDVLFAALFGAVVSTDDAEEIDVNLDILQAMTQEEHPDKQDGEGALATALLFAVSDEPSNYLNQDEGGIAVFSKLKASPRALTPNNIINAERWRLTINMARASNADKPKVLAS